MGSPLGSALANIFVGFYESKLFDKISKPKIYYRYVDDTFALFQDEVDSETFLTNLNSLHTLLKFTSEKEVNQSLPFFDVLVTKSTNNFTTSVYRKAANRRPCTNSVPYTSGTKWSTRSDGFG